MKKRKNSVENTSSDEVETSANAAAESVASADPSEDVEENETAIALGKALVQIEDLKQALQRERADFVNYKKRIGREQGGLQEKLAGDFWAKIVPILDDFERALGAIPEAEQSADWVTGMKLIHRKLQSLAEAEGIRVVNPLGEAFDPNFHEAIGMDAASEEYESGQVSAVLQKGYAKGERVLRPAMVRVAD